MGLNVAGQLARQHSWCYSEEVGGRYSPSNSLRVDLLSSNMSAGRLKSFSSLDTGNISKLSCSGDKTSVVSDQRWPVVPGSLDRTKSSGAARSVWLLGGDLSAAVAYAEYTPCGSFCLDLQKDRVTKLV